MSELWIRDFDTMREAEEYLRARGFSVGRLQGSAPRGIMLGTIDIQKWRNLDANDRRLLHGALLRFGYPLEQRSRILIDADVPPDVHEAIRAEPIKIRCRYPDCECTPQPKRDDGNNHWTICPKTGRRP